MDKTWYKLDNAAKVFPPIFKKDWANGYRVSCLMKENVSKEILEKATYEALERFPAFCVKLKRGFFWYYLDHNYKLPIIEEENPELLKDLSLRYKNEFMFQVCYFGKRISLDILHEITDANGALEFLKTIIYYYCVFSGYDIQNDENIKTNKIDQVYSEVLDDFNENYKDIKIKKTKEEKAFHLNEKRYKDKWGALYQLQMPTDAIKELAHKHNTTITGFIGGILMFSLYNVYFKYTPQKHNARLFIPVNARKYFESMSTRNFMSFVRTSGDIRGENTTFEDCVKVVDDTLKNNLNKEYIQNQIVKNVKIEKFFPLQICPLFIKDIALIIGYYFGGQFANTATFSNIGLVKIHDSFNNYVERFEFVMCGTPTNPVGFGCCSFNNKLVLSMGTLYRDRKWIKEIAKILVDFGVDVIVNSNDTEVL